MRLLLVDDDRNVLEALSAALRRLRKPWDVDCEHRPKRAARRLQQEHFDVVVCDLMMPGLDGVSLLSTTPHNPLLRKVAMSGFGELESSVRSTTVAHAFLQKPASAASLVQLIESWASTPQAPSLNATTSSSLADEGDATDARR